MRNKLAILGIAFAFCAVALFLGGTTGVEAVGPPSDNTTALSFPADERPQDMIEPQVPYIRRGVTSQSDSPQPGIITRLTGDSGEDIATVTGDEVWFLDVDINMPDPPGWIYIYEYLPGGDALQGRWIAYKWELSHSGLWQLGPFTPESDEPEGEHIYNIWFYSDGQWAGEDPDEQQGNAIYWIYQKEQHVEPEVTPIPPSPSSPSPPPQEPGVLDRIKSFITQPIGIGLLVLLLVLIGILGYFLYRNYFKRTSVEEIKPLPDDEEPEEVSEISPETPVGAVIALPNGVEIQLTSNSRVIGRGDLARALGLDDLGLISRRHFEIKSENEQFYIEDLGSANGTVCNGADIKGKGPVALSDDDVIEPAGIISLKFLLL